GARDAGDEVRPLDRRDAERGAAVPRERASFICAGRTADQHIAVPVLEPDGQDVRVAVQADKAELADDRAAEEVGRAWVQSAAILSVDPTKGPADVTFSRWRCKRR